MSNYLSILHTAVHTEAISAWLEKHSDPSEIFRTTIARDQHLVIVSKNVLASVSGDQYLRGTVVSTAHDALGFGIDGWGAAPRRMRNAPDEHEGEYCAIHWDRHGVSIDRDVFGMVRLFMTSADGLSAGSDSIAVLGSLRRAIGAGLTPNVETFLYRAALNNVSHQQMSSKTTFREITFVPSGHGVQLTKPGKWRLTRTSLGERAADRRGSYKDSARNVALDIARVMRTLVDVPGWHAELSLSGGYDSRTVFAAALAAGTASELIATSGRASATEHRDYDVAEALSHRFGVQFGHNLRTPDPNGPADERLTHWGASLAGAYDNFGNSRTRRWFPHTFALTGIGAETAKGNWGWQTWPELVKAEVKEGEKHNPPPVYSAFVAAGIQGIESMGGDPARPDASELLYLGYRSGLHSGAGHVSIHMTGIQPLQQLSLTRLGHLRDRKSSAFRNLGAPSTITDLSILLHLDAAVFEYDTADRNITKAYATDRLAALGGTIPPKSITPLKVFGDPGRVPEGPSALSMSISRGLGFAGELTGPDVLARAAENIELLPNSVLQGLYREIAANAKWMIGKRGGHVLSAGGAPGKTAALSLLRL